MTNINFREDNSERKTKTHFAILFDTKTTSNERKHQISLLFVHVVFHLKQNVATAKTHNRFTYFSTAMTSTLVA